MEISGPSSHGSYGDAIDSAGSEFDVFLSFHGHDTRRGITDHLYESMSGAGLRVFKDDEEIHRGEEIGGELQRAISNSRVYAVVFSRNYASSAWCLRELAMMVDLCSGSAAGRKIILPIFYSADPYDVKLRTELYRKALDGHKGRYGHEVVKNWAEALVSVGQISGWDSNAIEGEGRFVRLIVQDIIGKLRVKDRSLPDHLTGIDDRVSEMLNLLDCVSSSGVRLVVLHGMRGIGKTTLASAVYNKISSQFERSSFLSNVRASSADHEGIAKLHNKLSSDVLGVQQTRSCNFDDEVNDIITRLRGKRLLLVFDDVDKTSQLKKLVGDHLRWLGRGSRIVITTRDRSVCNGFNHSGLLYFYEMNKMKDDHALQLFSRHAFGTDEPPQDYVSLAKQVVKATGNLPLALEVIGGHLCFQSQDLWMNTLEKLKQVPPKEVFEILRVSYEGLDFREREIFLDIACFWEQMPRKYADHLWEARHLYPKCGVTVLVNKSLIKILPDGEFWIHDQLQDMGREIVRSEGLGSPRNYSRLWDPDDAKSVMLRKEVTEKIIALNLGRLYWNEHVITDEDFRGLSNLLYLQLPGFHSIRDWDHLPARLLWLSFEIYPEVFNSNLIKMNNLVILRISRTVLPFKIGDLCVEKLIMPNLRVLEIRGLQMKTTPDVSSCLKLEIIIFGSCPELQAIHGSIGELENLTSLTIDECRSLRILPEGLGRARALQELIVNLSGIEELPDSIGSLESLRVLVLEYSKIRKLPITISFLKKLEKLDASGCPLNEGIPEEIGRLTSLVNLNLQESELCQLPTTISQLSSLKSLNLERCYELGELPELPTSLTEFRFTSHSLRVAPALSALTNLTKLKLLSYSLEVVPDLSALTNLTELTLGDYEFGGYGLQDMWYDNEQVSVGMGSQSQPLELSWLWKLGKLMRLELFLARITVVLTTELGSLSTSLKELHLSYPNMESVSRLPSSLSKLTLSCSRTAIPWTCYSNLRFLKELVLVGFGLEDIQLGGLDSLDSLQTLKFIHCPELLRLPNLGSLRSLTSLSFYYCQSLVEIPGLEELELLEDLSIRTCYSIRSIPDLSDLRRLKRVEIRHCPKLDHMPCMVGECHLSIGA